MGTDPLVNEALALTKKKVNMTLDELIKLSKITAASKGKRPVRFPNRCHGFMKGSASQSNSGKIQNYFDSRSAIRQGVLARRRSSTLGSQFLETTKVARMAAALPIQNRTIDSNKLRFITIQSKAQKGTTNVKDKQLNPRQTLDARFSNMKEQRMKLKSLRISLGGGSRMNLRVQCERLTSVRRLGGRCQAAAAAWGRQFANFAKHK